MNMPSKCISSVEALRSFIPNYSKILDKRIQSKLDAFSLEFIHAAKIAFLASNIQDECITPLNIKDDLSIINHQLLHIHKICKQVDEQAHHNKTSYASLYFMAPGLGHGLRIKGTLCHQGTHRNFNITQIYFHCARAAARADIWSAHSLPALNVQQLIQHSPFLLLKTMNAQGETEISPRGDHAGFVNYIADKVLLVPERPGNKVAISLRNIIENSEIELLFLMPGSNYTLSVTGTAEVISDPALLSRCAINKKAPKLGIRVRINTKHLNDDSTFDKSGIWDKKNALEKQCITPFSKALSAHINGTGLLGKATHSIISAVVNHDMKNLY